MHAQVSLSLTELTQLGEPKCLYGGKRVTWQGQKPILKLTFVLHENCSPHLVDN